MRQFCMSPLESIRYRKLTCKLPEYLELLGVEYRRWTSEGTAPSLDCAASLSVEAPDNHQHASRTTFRSPPLHLCLSPSPLSSLSTPRLLQLASSHRLPRQLRLSIHLPLRPADPLFPSGRTRLPVLDSEEQDLAQGNDQLA
jgi:hypothetical protein